MIMYTVISALLMTFAIPLQFLDMVVGIIYPLKEATLVLIGSKLLGASFSYYIANNLLSEETRRSYTSSKYLRGLHELVEREPLKYGLLIRFSSIPIIIRNYGLSVLPIKYATFIACVFIQSSVSSPFQAYAGSHFTSFMDFAAQQTGQLDEQGNPVGGIKESEKMTGMLVVVLGLLCSLFVAYKIKRKVDEINREAEETMEKKLD